MEPGRFTLRYYLARCWTVAQSLLIAGFRSGVPLYVEVGDCAFPEAGLYSFEIYFSARGGGEALKGEHQFTVLSYEE
jgi:hypothetical protein